MPPHEGYTRSRLEPRPRTRAGRRLLAAALADTSQPLLLVMHLKALAFSLFSLYSLSLFLFVYLFLCLGLFLCVES